MCVCVCVCLCSNFMICHYIIQVKYDIILICSMELFFSNKKQRDLIFNTLFVII